MSHNTLQHISKMLSPQDMKRLARSADKAQKLETKWRNKTEKVFAQLEEHVVRAFKEGRRPPQGPDFEALIAEHGANVLKESLELAKTEDELDKKPPKRLAKGESKIPKSLRDLIKKLDEYRSGKKLPKKQAELAKKIEQTYLQKVRDVFEKYADEYLNGESADRENIIKKVRQATKAAESRAQTIVQTETTNYFNDARTAYYDESDDVTHYLFVAIRDHATTKWCHDRQGLVYKKGTKLAENECPACHWNCRSEFLPLTPLNPVHLKLIKNKSLWRENNKCEPLPPGWRAA